MTTALSPQRRYTRALSSPIQPSHSAYSPSKFATISPGSIKTASEPQSVPEPDPVSKLAALPSLSKSLNHLPALAGQSGKQIPVYEGMPSRAQKSSHEKLKMALGNSPAGKHAHEKNGFYTSPFFSMTPMHTNTAQSRIQHTGATQRQKTFRLYVDEDDDEDHVDA
ncbi:hypothetical protein FRB99_006594 [Tulasnella sp. 403]|nr:hypothetical protein FRB99_006594 [Tulasnella sp. 403]